MICFNTFFAALNLFCFYVFQNNSPYIRGLNLACCLISSLSVIIDVIEKKKISVKNISKIKTTSPEIEIEKHGSYYYKETCPTCGCIFNFDPHSLGFSYDNIGEENETRTEWIYCPECAHKLEWQEGYHKKLNY